MRDGKPFVLSPRVVIRDADGCVLMIQRSSKSTYQGGQWELPGGKIDEGEDFATALRREAEEETGLAISLDRVVGAAQWDGHPDLRVAYIILEGRVTSGDLTISDEHDEMEWVQPAAVLSLDLCDQFRPFLESYCGREETKR